MKWALIVNAMHATDMLYRQIISNSVAWKQAARQPAGLESRTVAVGQLIGSYFTILEVCHVVLLLYAG